LTTGDSYSTGLCRGCSRRLRVPLAPLPLTGWGTWGRLRRGRWSRLPARSCGGRPPPAGTALIGPLRCVEGLGPGRWGHRPLRNPWTAPFFPTHFPMWKVMGRVWIKAFEIPHPSICVGQRRLISTNMWECSTHGRAGAGQKGPWERKDVKAARSDTWS